MLKILYKNGKETTISGRVKFHQGEYAATCSYDFEINGENGEYYDNIKLAYKFDIYASNPVSRGDLYIDANTGEVLFYNATIKHLGQHAHGAKTTKQAFSKTIENKLFISVSQ